MEPIPVEFGHTVEHTLSGHQSIKGPTSTEYMQLAWKWFSRKLYLISAWHHIDFIFAAGQLRGHRWSPNHKGMEEWSDAWGSLIIFTGFRFAQSSTQVQWHLWPLIIPSLTHALQSLRSAPQIGCSSFLRASCLITQSVFLLVASSQREGTICTC